jgi:hypothetical protein
MTSNNKGGHEWIIEFTQKPESLEIFTDELDAELKRLNSDYEAKRYMDMAMLKPVIRVAPKGTFNEWLKLKGKLGGQHKVPRLCNNREILESILELMKSEQQLQVFAN